MFVVIKPFRDMQDNNFVYKAGDQFPRDGAEVSEDRLKELSSSDNKIGRPLIMAEKLMAEEEPTVEIMVEVVPDEELQAEKKPKKTTKKKRNENAD